MADPYAAYEARRLSELAAVGADAGLAKEVARSEWQQMDAAARDWWRQQALAAEGIAGARSRKRPAEEPGPPRAGGPEAVEDSDFELVGERIEGGPASGPQPRRAPAPAAAPAAEAAGGGAASSSRAPKRRRAPAAQAAAAGGAPAKRSTAAPGGAAPAPGAGGGGAAAAGAAAGAAAAPGEWLWPGRARAEKGEHVDAEEGAAAGAAEGPQPQRAFRESRTVRLGPAHPDPLTEPSAIADIDLPQLSEAEVLRLPLRVAAEGLLSSPQLESAAYAARRFRALLPSGARAGYYLGDGTGCGKGRVIAALVWHLWNSGARRHLWLSASADLLADARRDFRDLGASDVPVSMLSSWGYGPISGGRGLSASGDGVIFANYSLLVAARGGGGDDQSPTSSRLGQVIDWLRGGAGSAQGLIALDEAHCAKNVVLATEQGQTVLQGSRAGMCVSELQRACPSAAVLYASATGATEIRHLGYLERLGLWGQGRPHATFEELRAAVESGGLAAMELLAMTMRAEGMLSCRSLSFSGAAFRLVPVALEGAARGVYEAACALWQRALLVAKRLGKAKKLEVKRMKQKNNSEVKDLSFYMRSFWACQQQFFRQLLICAKVDEATKLAEAALLRGEAVVISMWSTGESVTQARLRREGPDAAEAFASAPREIALRMSEKILAPMVEHIRCDRERSQFEVELIGLGTALKDMPLPANPLDDLLARLGGPGKVAELTGRSRRLVRRAGGMHWEDRGDGANLAEQEAFQSGRKLVAIITEAASAGISLHCDRRLPTAGQRPRYMISIELPWEADKAIQQLGRVHRSNQLVPPKFAIVVTDLGGEVRFVSAVARRLRILGAMMRGDRNSAHGAVQSLSAFDVQNRYGRRALSRLFELMRTKGADSTAGVAFSFVGPRRGRASTAGKRHWPSWVRFCDEASKALAGVGINLDTEDKYDESFRESHNLNVFLNRILMIEPGLQNALFDAVAEIYVEQVGADRADGLFDGGLESLDRQGSGRASVTVAHREVLYEDPETGAQTVYVRLRLDRGISWPSAAETAEDRCSGTRDGFHWRRGGSAARDVILAVPRPRLRGGVGEGDGEDDDDEDDQLCDVYTAHGLAGRPVRRGALRSEPFGKVARSEMPEAERCWRKQHAGAGAGRVADEHVLTGSILNTWAVLGDAIGCAPTPVRAGGAPKKIPLVRASLADGGAVVGVRVRAEQLEQVRYALRALREAAQAEPGDGAAGASGLGAAEAAPPSALEVQGLSEHLEAFLKAQPDRCAVWHGWAGAHRLLADAGLVDPGPAGMQAAREAIEDLDRNGKIDVDDAAGTVHLREKQKGCGWYIPPPKKPKPGGRGRGRGGRGAARGGRASAPAAAEPAEPAQPARGRRSGEKAAVAAEGRAQQEDPSERRQRLAMAAHNQLEDLRGAVMGRLRALRQDIPLDLNRWPERRLRERYDHLLPRQFRGGDDSECASD